MSGDQENRQSPIATLFGHESQISDIEFSPDGNVLATSSGDATVRLWRARSFREIDAGEAETVARQ